MKTFMIIMTFANSFSSLPFETELRVQESAEACQEYLISYTKELRTEGQEARFSFDENGLPVARANNQMGIQIATCITN